MKTVMLSRVLRRVERSIRRRGLRGAIAHVLKLEFRSANPGTSQGADFDQRHGTDTSGLIDQIDLDTAGNDNWIYATHYTGTRAEFFGPAIDSLPIDRGRFTFLDLGSGKGLAVMLAAEAGFGKSVGVELAESLHKTAQENIHRVQHEFPCRMETIYGDAADFILPSDPVVLYLNNPFQEAVMRSVVGRAIERASAAVPFFIVYVNPECRTLWQRAEFIEMAKAGDGRWIVWRSRGNPA